MHIARIALRNISRNKKRSILSAVAITISVTGTVFLFSFLVGFIDNIRTNLQNFVSGDVRIRHSDYDTFEHLSPLHLTVTDANAVAERVRALPEVAQAVVRIPFGGLIFQDNETSTVQLLAADFADEDRYQNFSELLLMGVLPQSDANEGVVGQQFLEKNNLQLGDRVTILSNTSTRGSNAFTIKIVGIVAFPYGQLDRDCIMIPLARAQYFLRMGDGATEILIKNSDNYDANATQQAIAAILPSPNIAIKRWDEISISASLLRSALISYAIIAFVFFVLSSTVIINTTMMVIFERIREIGTLGAMGMHSKQLIMLFYLEAIFISMFGAALGILLGSGLVWITSIVGLDVSAQLSEVNLQVSTIIYPRTTTIVVVGVFLYAIIIAGLATLLPVQRSARIKPVEALRSA